MNRQETSRFWTQSAKNVYVAAHRGWSAAYPENTMEAFEAAIRAGADQIESDVRVTADGELVLMHDERVDRTTDQEGRVIDHTLAQLRRMDAGSKKDAKFAHARIPTMAEWLDLVKDHPTMTLDIELKEYPTPGREALSYSVCDRAIAMVEEYGFGDRVVLNTFSGKLQEYIRDNYGDRYRQHVYFPVSCMSDVTVAPMGYGYCACMFGGDHGMATAEEFEQVRGMGVRTWAGASVKDAATLDVAISRGAELITCNDPALILALLRERGLHR